MRRVMAGLAGVAAGAGEVFMTAASAWATTVMAGRQCVGGGGAVGGHGWTGLLGYGYALDRPLVVDCG